MRLVPGPIGVFLCTLLAVSYLASACTLGNDAPSPTPTSSTVESGSPTPTAFRAAELNIAVLEPGELGAVADDLVLTLDSGWSPNDWVSYTSWNPGDDAAYWGRLGRIDGYELSMWGYIGDDSAFITTAAELFRDERSAARGLDAWVKDVHFADVAVVGEGGYTNILERPLSDVGDEAILVSSDVPETGDRLSLVLLRRGPMVGTVIIWREKNPSDEEAATLARLLDSRFERALSGQLEARPVPVPGPFVPREEPPSPLTLNDPAFAQPVIDTGCPGTGRRICLMGLGSEVDVDLEAIAAHLREAYGLEVAVLPPMSIKGRGADWPQLADYTEGRLESNSVWAILHEDYPTTTNDLDVTLIVVTSYDFYNAERPNLNYFYRAAGEKTSIVSNARFDDASFGLPANPDALRSRTQKFVTRQVGELYYGLPLDVTDDRYSLMQTFPVTWGIDRFDDDLDLGGGQ